MIEEPRHGGQGGSRRTRSRPRTGGRIDGDNVCLACGKSLRAKDDLAGKISCVAIHAMGAGSVGIAIARTVDAYEAVEDRNGFALYVLAVPMVLRAKDMQIRVRRRRMTGPTPLGSVPNNSRNEPIARDC